MANKHAAFNEVMGELKDRIRGHSASKLERSASPRTSKTVMKKRDPETEPDGDEDAEGNEYPGSPDDVTPVENVSIQQEERMPKGATCKGCDAPKGKGHKYCPHCGSGH